MDTQRKIALVVIIIFIFGLLYLSGGFLYVVLDKIYGQPKKELIIHCSLLEENLKNIQQSFEKISKTCGEITSTTNKE